MRCGNRTFMTVDEVAAELGVPSLMLIRLSNS